MPERKSAQLEQLGASPTFLQRPRFVLGREQLLDPAWGRAAQVFDQTIDNQISRLRRKIQG